MLVVTGVSCVPLSCLSFRGFNLLACKASGVETGRVLGVCSSSLSSRLKSYCPASVIRPEPSGQELSQMVAELIEI